MEAWDVIFNRHISGWHKKLVVSFVVFGGWAMESRFAADSGVVI